MKLHLLRFGFLAAGWMSLAGLSAKAQVITPSFVDETNQPGSITQDYQFTGLSLDNHPTYPSLSGTGGGLGAWPAPIAADGGNTTASLNRPNTAQYTDFLSNASFGGGVYSFFSNTQYAITQTAPLSNVSSLTFQIYEAAGDDGAAFNNIYMTSALPTLTLNLANSTQVTITGTPIGDVNGISGLLAQSPPVVIFGQNTNLDDVGFSFNTSDLSAAVSSYTLNMDVPMHSITYGFDVTEAQAVPEPSTWALLVFAGAAFHFMRIRQRKMMQV